MNNNGEKLKYKICILKGDGIGKEVIPETIRLLKELPIVFEFVEEYIGYEHYQKTGQYLPQKTIDTMKECHAGLFGAVTTPTDIPNYRSPIAEIRKELDLYANVRPAKSIPSNISRKDIDLVIIRENTEGLYVKDEQAFNEGTDDEYVISKRKISKKGSERIIRYAFEFAKRHNRKNVTLLHKSNVIRMGDSLFRTTGERISKEYPEINYNQLLADAATMHLVKDPENFDVIVATNLIGDLLSDGAAGLIGGMGLAPSGNIGKKYALFIG